MGLFNLFKSKGKDGEKKSNPAAKWAEAAGSKRAQAYDRQEAIAELCRLKSAEAVAALLRRFTFSTNPSITDQEEKDAAFEGIIGADDEAIEPVRAFVVKAESVAWPMRVLVALLEPDELVEELLVWLARWDTEYAKFIDPKLRILTALGDYKHEKIREAVEPFLQDVNEPARFHAVAATLAQKDPAAVPALLALLVDEESVRVRAKIADGFVALAWGVPRRPAGRREEGLAPQYGVDGAGLLTKR